MFHGLHAVFHGLNPIFLAVFEWPKTPMLRGRQKGCESPHDVGRYVHPSFAWPCSEQLMVPRGVLHGGTWRCASYLVLVCKSGRWFNGGLMDG